VPLDDATKLLTIVDHNLPLHYIFTEREKERERKREKERERERERERDLKCMLLYTTFLFLHFYIFSSFSVLDAFTLVFFIK